MLRQSRLLSGQPDNLYKLPGSKGEKRLNKAACQAELVEACYDIYPAIIKESL